MKIVNIHRLLLFCLLLFAFSSCKKEIETPTDVQSEYFPFEVGNYSIYQVDSIVYNLPFEKLDTFSYQIKEEMESKFFDNQGRSTMRIVRSYRQTASDNWVIKNIWSSNKNSNRAERQENNLVFVKMVFPVKDNIKWNGNLLNTLGEQEYEYLNSGIPYNQNGINYEETCTINQLTDTNLIYYKKFHEVYAKNIGLIYKEIYDVESNNITSNSVLDRINTGVICKFKLLEHGKN